VARLNVHSETVRNLVEKVAPLFLAHGSIAALTKSLNEALSSGGLEEVLHPNRLHTLLSDDVSRGINEATLKTIDHAATIALADAAAVRSAAAKKLDELRRQAARLKQFAGATRDELMQNLALPPAIFHLVVPETVVPPVVEGSSRPLSGETPSTTPAQPDWGYQDTAVARCLVGYDRNPAARLGLVLPTGGGKTRTALRTILEFMAKRPTEKGPVYWVTHRKNLRSQAHRELQKLKTSPNVLPADASLLAGRIKFVMLSELPNLLSADAARPAMIVIDEAHHAAASSYKLALNAPWPVPVLALTATPNRGDRLPIGVDEIAFTITYRELAERGAILAPSFLDFPVEDFDWSPAAIGDLADYIVDRTEAEFTKVLVLAPRVDRVEEFHAALVARLAMEPGHPLDEDDVGFIHGGGNSIGGDNEDFLARFAAKPRAILVSAQLLLEGFDDPAINTVVLTYPSSSMIRLMQAAGRCVRYAPDKSDAYVVQARNDEIAYHFDQRWLYQEIDDVLRPELVDTDYGDAGDRQAKVASLMAAHHVDAATQARILAQLERLGPGETCRVFLYGLPYYGTRDSFGSDARWGAILESPESVTALRGIFNAFCAIGADLSDPTDFLAREGAAFALVQDFTPGSRWLQLSGLLTASYFAKREIYGPEQPDAAGPRPYLRAGPTTWLKYITFHYRPVVPIALSAFLADCHNGKEIEAAYLRQPDFYAAIKAPLPLGGEEAFLMDAAMFTDFQVHITALREGLAAVPPGEQFGALSAYLASIAVVQAPLRLVRRLEFLLSEAARAQRTLVLAPKPIDPAA
jgi:superfamily II DNA or RNA helicase